jgi:hypothetical protein
VTLVGGLIGTVTVGVGGLLLLGCISTDAKMMEIIAKIIIEDVTPNAICTLFDGLLIVEFPIRVFYDTVFSKRKC